MSYLINGYTWDQPGPSSAPHLSPLVVPTCPPDANILTYTSEELEKELRKTVMVIGQVKHNFLRDGGNLDNIVPMAQSIVENRIQCMLNRCLTLREDLEIKRAVYIASFFPKPSLINSSNVRKFTFSLPGIGLQKTNCQVLIGTEPVQLETNLSENSSLSESHLRNNSLQKSVKTKFLMPKKHSKFEILQIKKDFDRNKKNPMGVKNQSQIKPTAPSKMQLMKLKRDINTTKMSATKSSQSSSPSHAEQFHCSSSGSENTIRKSVRTPKIPLPFEIIHIKKEFDKTKKRTVQNTQSSSQSPAEQLPGTSTGSENTVRRSVRTPKVLSPFEIIHLKKDFNRAKKLNLKTQSTSQSDDDLLRLYNIKECSVTLHRLSASVIRYFINKK